MSTRLQYELEMCLFCSSNSTRTAREKQQDLIRLKNRHFRAKIHEKIMCMSLGQNKKNLIPNEKSLGILSFVQAVRFKLGVMRFETILSRLISKFGLQTIHSKQRACNNVFINLDYPNISYTGLRNPNQHPLSRWITTY